MSPNFQFSRFHENENISVEFVAPCLPVANVQCRLTSPSTTNLLLSLITLIDLSLLPSTCYYQGRPSRIINNLKCFQFFWLWYCLHYQGTADESRRQMSCIGNGGQRLEVRDGRIKTEAPRKNTQHFKALIMNGVAFVRWLDLRFYLYCFNELMTLPILLILHALAMTLRFNWWRRRQSRPVHFAVYKKWCAVYQASIYLY